MRAPRLVQRGGERGLGLLGVPCQYLPLLPCACLALFWTGRCPLVLCGAGGAPMHEAGSLAIVRMLRVPPFQLAKPSVMALQASSASPFSLLSKRVTAFPSALLKGGLQPRVAR